MDVMPCKHALAIVRKYYMNEYEYCSIYYKKNNLLNTYEVLVYPIPDESRVYGKFLQIYNTPTIKVQTPADANIGTKAALRQMLQGRNNNIPHLSQIKGTYAASCDGKSLIIIALKGSTIALFLYGPLFNSISFLFSKKFKIKRKSGIINLYASPELRILALKAASLIESYTHINLSLKDNLAITHCSSTQRGNNM
ncbi:hypothetical protein H5410_030795 [Solanum commersonii]|uniref:SWIM-type domain-containing protein n=1 Tax=Solanum commersonii TaxID=4109 RepID=A0A9J5YGQ4_SOLCO|nr:hypothetical protein H5410_030795 [Solanum commersonii]